MGPEVLPCCTMGELKNTQVIAPCLLRRPSSQKQKLCYPWDTVSATLTSKLYRPACHLRRGSVFSTSRERLVFKLRKDQRMYLSAAFSLVPKPCGTGSWETSLGSLIPKHERQQCHV
ncbi:hypothetical protein P171DRAFT_43994 [Karstenula rhodostoma CBS 690.94]|uniref:Uncharacterized protein n=1 Tax=Karstenula rhodostoma CBS 690.94 TaxID=1392251 RepID=A0A9P4PI86_9PLEO|nr:hypothetical protein P171DRAFT_43994 [Karstenula rhodostoma CBS 690.94]